MVQNTDRRSLKFTAAVFCFILVELSEIQLVCDGRTDGPTKGPTDGPTDGRTYPLIEMRERM